MGKKIKLNADQIEYLRGLPEKGMGYQIVNLVLKNGQTLHDIVVLNSTYLKVEGTVTLGPNDIDRIEIKGTE